MKLFRSLIVLLFLVIVLLLPLICLPAPQPFPEWLKESPQILSCRFRKYDDGVEVINYADTWVVTWGMAVKWEPGVWILFRDKHGRETVIPTPEEYTCGVL